MQHLGLDLPRDEFDVTYEGRNLYTKENTKDCHFHGFVKAQRWQFDATTYKVQNQGVPETDSVDYSRLMQSWLFFGLIAAVVFDDNSRDFDWNLLVKNNKIDTTELPKILRDWRIWEMDEKNKPGQNMRMIRAQLALDVARNVVMNHSPTTKKRGPLELNPNLALCLKILGETLTNAKSKIIKKMDFKAKDWYGDASIGWGIPWLVLDKMDTAGWCPRTKELLKYQLKENATALLSVYLSHPQYAFTGHTKAGCNEDEPCKLQSEDDRKAGDYATKHHSECLHGKNGSEKPCHPDFSCRGDKDKGLQKDEKEHSRVTCFTPCVGMIGIPDMGEVVSIIEAGRFPLFKFKDETSGEDPVQIEVVDSADYQDYATISHVWSDGYGNPTKNRLFRCQLAYFRDLLREAESQKSRHNRGATNGITSPLPFWIDTLAIPVEAKYKSWRKKAISQIYEVYARARYTIVIDNGLSNMSWNDKDYTSTAMRILASGWMRRLWTLQEAYLSRKIFIAFQRWEDNLNQIPLKDLDEIEDLYVDADDALVSSLPTNARSYYHNMLGQDRKARIHKLTATNSIGLVASVWKAAQWRTTSKREHETLALATLLNLDYKKTAFAGGELLKEKDKSGMRLPEYDEKLMEYMTEFWTILEKDSPGAIPPGIIFMPGDRIRKKGFGWAPRSWMEAQGADYPDPISVVHKSAKLEPEKGGLLVEFPGFLLHCQKNDSIIGHTKAEGFWFPSDSSLSEWYHAKKADIKEYSVNRGSQGVKDLAIILSRPRPREMAEIGLLVEIEETKQQRELGKDVSKRIFRVYIHARVKVKREFDKTILDQKKEEIINSRKAEFHERIICGEALEENQQWYVDIRSPTDNTNEKKPKISVNTSTTSRQRPMGMKGDGEAQIDLDNNLSPAVTETPDRTPSVRSSANYTGNHRTSSEVSRPIGAISQNTNGKTHEPGSITGPQNLQRSGMKTEPPEKSFIDSLKGSMRRVLTIRGG